jgi:hypothetical protein
VIRRDPAARYGDAGPVSKFAAHRWWIDLWFGPPDMVMVTAAEVPALAITTLAGHPRFADSPLCVIADRAAKRLVVIPSWEIFRHYYAQSDQVARSAFRFPAWQHSTLDDLLAGFDGHAFVERRRWATPPPDGTVGLSEASRYAGERLVAIGRDTVVGYALTGRAHIRALPPVGGPARLLVVAVAAQLGPFAALFVQHIVDSGPQEGEPGPGLGERQPGVIRWTPAPS